MSGYQAGDETAIACRPDGVFVQTFGLHLPTFQACDFGADERGAVFEVVRAVLGPLLELAMVGGQCLLVPGTFRVSSPMAERSACQRSVELVVCLLRE